jgi:hypothetical protein
VDQPKRERKSLHARIEKLDLELSLKDGARLRDRLVHPQLRNQTVALVLDVNPVSGARRLPIDEHAKSKGRSGRSRSHDEIKIVAVKAVCDVPMGLVENDGFSTHRLIAR